MQPLTNKVNYALRRGLYHVISLGLVLGLRGWQRKHEFPTILETSRHCPMPLPATGLFCELVDDDAVALIGRQGAGVEVSRVERLQVLVRLVARRGDDDLVCSPLDFFVII